MRNKNNHMPDVLDCLANLSNDEVFTPPDIANKMLDMLPKEVFESTETTFLDPFTKSGVFLREITKRLLENQIPEYKKISSEIEEITKTAIQIAVKEGRLDLKDDDYETNAKRVGDKALMNHPDAEKYVEFEIKLQKVLEHVLTKQVFGIACTELTSYLSRRSLYCSKDASGRYSIVETIFKRNRDGNIRFVPMRHTWKNGSCIYCGASASNLDRPDEFESHAYEFIHKDIEEIRKEYKNMEFTVICGNPPYQLKDGEGGNGSSATPIYHLFIEQAKRLNPKNLIMIVPSRWMTGGKGLDEFRNIMIHDDSIRELHDFANSQDCFTGVDIKGGVCYFLRDRDYHGDCLCTRYDVNGINSSLRPLCEREDDIFIRQNELIPIKKKVASFKELSFANIVSAAKPYGLRADTIKRPQKYGLPSFNDSPIIDGYEVFGLDDGNKRVIKYVSIDYPFPRISSSLNQYKIFISKAYGCGEIGEIPATPVLATPGQACTETFLEIGPFESEKERNNAYSYIQTKFFRAMVGIRKQTQNTSKDTYLYVPMQDFSKPWTDAELYAKYGLTQEEIDFIELMIKPME